METFEDFQKMTDDWFKIFKFLFGGFLFIVGVILGFFPYAHINALNNVFILIGIIAISVGGATIHNSAIKLEL